MNNIFGHLSLKGNFIRMSSPIREGRVNSFFQQPSKLNNNLHGQETYIKKDTQIKEVS